MELKMRLFFNGIVNEYLNTKDIQDRRKKIDLYVVSYLDKNGDEYRKSFKFPPKTKNIIDKIPKIWSHK
jgi:hypothetical protein